MTFCTLLCGVSASERVTKIKRGIYLNSAKLKKNKQTISRVIYLCDETLCVCSDFDRGQSR